MASLRRVKRGLLIAAAPLLGAADVCCPRAPAALTRAPGWVEYNRARFNISMRPPVRGLNIELMDAIAQQNG